MPGTAGRWEEQTEDPVGQWSGGEEGKKGMGYRGLAMASVYNTIFPKNDSNVEFAYAYCLERNRVNVIFEEQG